MKKYMMLLVVCGLVLFVSMDVLANANPNADANNVFATAMGKAAEAFQNTRALVFTIGGFALVGLAAAAIFSKINWKWVGALAMGLGILAVASGIVGWAQKSANSGGNLVNSAQSADYWGGEAAVN